MVSLEIDVDLSGEILTGNPDRVVQEALAYALTQAGQTAVEHVHRILDQRIMHPTPYYETQITLDHPPGHVRVHDRDVPYGPWLEGISPRNTRSRFKGYHQFRETQEWLQPRLQGIAESAIARYVARLEG